MNSFEYWLASFGMSWQMVKLLPYFVLMLLGFIIAWKLARKIAKKGTRALISICAAQLFVGAYFVFSPIYQGDFTVQQHFVKPLDEAKTIKNNELIVLALPGCEHCLASIDLANLLVKRKPNLKIRYLVLSEEMSSISNYKKVANRKITFELAKNQAKMEAFAHYSFPSFLLKRNNKVYRWNGSEIGPRTLDFIEG